jgi:hypothetical protein
MRLKVRLGIILPFFSVSYGQNCINQYAYTNTIVGTYTAPIVSQSFTNSFYIAPGATVTGNIDLNYGQLQNCGVIKSSKIKLKNVTQHNAGSLFNRGTIIIDSLILDSLGDLHNMGSFTVNQIVMNYQANITNDGVLSADTLITGYDCTIDNGQGASILTKETKILTSTVYSYGLLYAKGLFYCGQGSPINNFCTIEVDSCFVNYGMIGGMNHTNTGQIHAILINGKSENHGNISNLEVCDHSSLTGGFDINDGNLIGAMTYCTKDPTCLTLHWVGIKELDKLESVLVFPNPVKDKINIRIENMSGNEISIEVINSLGQVIIGQFAIVGKMAFDFSELKTGLYFLRLSNSNAQQTFKIIKE